MSSNRGESDQTFDANKMAQEIVETEQQEFQVRVNLVMRQAESEASRQLLLIRHGQCLVTAAKYGVDPDELYQRAGKRSLEKAAKKMVIEQAEWAALDIINRK